MQVLNFQWIRPIYLRVILPVRGFPLPIHKEFFVLCQDTRKSEAAVWTFRFLDLHPTELRNPAQFLRLIRDPTH